MVTALQHIQEPECRYERKFFVENGSMQAVLLACRLHPACFKPAFSPRQVNNLYLDTMGFDHYFDNVEGSRERMKVRIRWYGPLWGKIEKPVLEIKTKEGMVGGKYSFPLAAFELNGQFCKNQLATAFKGKLPAAIQDNVIGMKPMLLNQYQRHYLLSFDKKFRLTVDTGLAFHFISYGRPVSLQRSADPGNVILEMKYKVEDDATARKMTGLFPLMMTKSSKYVQGIDRLYH